MGDTHPPEGRVCDALGGHRSRERANPIHRDVSHRLYTLTELSERFGVSRQKLHKWLARHDEGGMKGLVGRSRAPLHIPHRTSDEVVEKITAFRRRFPHMGPRKIAARLAELHPGIYWPAPSTIGDILRRPNLVQPPSAARRPCIHCGCAASQSNRMTS